jgi:hypothetical protein
MVNPSQRSVREDDTPLLLCVGIAPDTFFTTSCCFLSALVVPLPTATLTRKPVLVGWRSGFLVLRQVSGVFFPRTEGVSLVFTEEARTTLADALR